MSAAHSATRKARPHDAPADAQPEAAARPGDGEQLLVPVRRRRLPRSRRLLAAVLLVTAMLAPLGVAVSLAWAQSSDDVTAAQNERYGAEYVKALGNLVVALGGAQSTAVHGSRPDAGPVDRAVAQVNAADAAHGQALAVTTHWTDLRTRIAHLTSSPGTDRAAYDRFTEAVDLTLDLVLRAGDASGLVVDPVLGTRYLADAALTRLPAAIVQAGRHADLLHIAVTGNAAGGVTAGRLDAATARSEFDTAADALDRDVHIAVDNAGSRSFGPALVAPMDDFRAAVDAFPAPPNDRLTAAAADAADQGAGRLRESGLRLDAAVLDGLDGLLTSRSGTDGGRRIAVGLVLVLGVLAAAAALWLLIPGQPDTGGQRAATRDDDAERGGATEHVRREPGSRRSEETAEALAEIRALLGARELLRSGELVRVGRAVRPGRRESGGDPQ
ncbi:MAG: hypothetical protein QOJ50_948 [Cryptosporangiaceae bacterium]|nr:hypothetical protein [Cryptosporangiaceae bacterium]